MRPVRDGEVPAFGSVWRWSSGMGPHPTDPFYVALGLRPLRGTHVMLLAIEIWPGEYTRPEFNDQMTWGLVHEGEVNPTPGWACVDEGLVDA